MDTARDNGDELLARLCAPGAMWARPSAMLVLAHPDDESVGAASLLPALGLGTFAYVTDGAPRNLHDAHAAGCATRDAYAGVRRGELLSALESIGIPAERIEFPQLVDQEASSHLVELTKWLEILIREHGPAVVVTHPYEGGHPDHDATAFAVHAACARIAAGGESPPVCAEFTSYHLAGAADSAPSVSSTAAGAAPAWEFGLFLPDPRRSVVVRSLSAYERAMKRRLLGCYASQRAVLDNAPLDFERFRVAPAYDFTAQPHPGVLLYEQQPWGMSGREWRERAARALAHLDARARNSERSAVAEVLKR